MFTLREQIEDMMMNSTHHKKDVLDDKKTMKIIEESINKNINTIITKESLLGESNA